MSTTAISAAINGLASAQERLDQNSTRIANFGNGQNETDLAAAIVGTAIASVQAKASLTVLKIQDENQKALLDIFA